MKASDPLTRVTWAAEARRKAEAKEQEAVRQAISAGCSWRQIAEASGRSVLELLSRKDRP